METTILCGFYGGYTGIMEKKIETTEVKEYRVYLSSCARKSWPLSKRRLCLLPMENKRETTIVYWGDRENGKENGNYSNGVI